MHAHSALIHILCFMLGIIVSASIYRKYILRQDNNAQLENFTDKLLYEIKEND